MLAVSSYGVDWRFMLSLVAQASILGGVAAAYAVEFVAPPARKKEKRASLLGYAAVAAAVAVVAFPAAQLLSAPFREPFADPPGPGCELLRGFCVKCEQQHTPVLPGLYL